MRHDHRFPAPAPHPDWCECRACAPRRSTLEQDIRETLFDTGLGLALGLIVAAAVLLIHFWPQIQGGADGEIAPVEIRND